MNAIFKTLIVGVMTMFAIVSQAASNGVGGYWVNNIVPNSWAVQNTLIQNATKYNYACGPTSLLFVDNHYIRQTTGSSPTYLTTIPQSKASLDRLYAYLGLTTNTITNLDQLKLIAKNKWGYANAVRMSASSTVAQNMNNLISYMNQDIPVLAPLRGGYSGNPVAPYEHIVIIYAYNKQVDEYGRAALDPNNTRNNDTIDWYEPYYGRQGRTLRKEVTSSGTTSAFSIAGFAFLAVGR